MFNNYLQSIEGVDTYAVFSLLVFFVFFIFLIIWMFRVDKSYLKKMGSLPLEPEENLNENFSGDKNEEQKYETEK